jgi:hypothetical protein
MPSTMTHAVFVFVRSNTMEMSLELLLQALPIIRMNVFGPLENPKAQSAQPNLITAKAQWEELTILSC